MQLRPVICSNLYLFNHYGHLPWLTNLNLYVLSEVYFFGVKFLGVRHEISPSSLGFAGKQREISDWKQWRLWL